MPNFLREMDIGVVPSTYAEPFALVPLEMMACGLPVVAYNIGGMKEAIVDGETGFFVENKNHQELSIAIEKLLDNSNLRTSMGKSARQRVEKYFSWERHIEQLLGIYDRILNNTN